MFDCFDGTLLERFRNATDVTMVEPTEPTRSVSQIALVVLLGPNSPLTAAIIEQDESITALVIEP